MKRKNVLFFSSSFRIRNLSRPRDTGFPRLWLVRSRRNLAAFARYTWRFSRGKERKKERKEGKKKKKMRDAIHSKRNFFESEYRCSEVNYAHFHRFLRFARGGRSNGGTGVVADITVVGRFDFSRIKDFSRSRILRVRKSFDDASINCID